MATEERDWTEGPRTGERVAYCGTVFDKDYDGKFHWYGFGGPLECIRPDLSVVLVLWAVICDDCAMHELETGELRISQDIAWPEGWKAGRITNTDWRH